MTIPFVYIKRDAIVCFKLGDSKHASSRSFRRGIPRVLRWDSSNGYLSLDGHNPVVVGDSCLLFFLNTYVNLVGGL